MESIKQKEINRLKEIVIENEAKIEQLNELLQFHEMNISYHKNQQKFVKKWLDAETKDEAKENPDILEPTKSHEEE